MRWLKLTWDLAGPVRSVLVGTASGLWHIDTSATSVNRLCLIQLLQTGRRILRLELGLSGSSEPTRAIMLTFSNILSKSVLHAPVATCLSQQLRLFASEPATAHDKAPPQLPPFDYQPQPYTGPSKEEVLSLRKQFLSPCTCPQSLSKAAGGLYRTQC